MMRRQGSKVSDVQKGCLKAPNKVDKHVVATVARGADEVIDFNLGCIKPVPGMSDPFWVASRTLRPIRRSALLTTGQT